MTNKLNLAFILTPLLLMIWIAACGGENTIREPAPDLPIIDIGAYDIDRTYFVFQLESDRSVDRDMFPRIVITYHGHYENDFFRRLSFALKHTDAYWRACKSTPELRTKRLMTSSERGIRNMPTPNSPFKKARTALSPLSS